MESNVQSKLLKTIDPTKRINFIIQVVFQLISKIS